MALKLADKLRHAGRTVDLGYSGNLGKRMKRANKIHACAAVLIGDDELEAGQATVRDLDTGDQSSVGLSELVDALQRYDT